MGSRGGRSHAGGGTQARGYRSASLLARSLGIRLDMASLTAGGINPRYVNETLHAVQGIYAEFPVMRGHVKYLDAETRSSRAYASAGGDGGLHMGLYGRWSESRLESQWRSDVASGWHPQGTTTAGIFVHEMGHQMEAYLNQRDYNAPWAWGKTSGRVVLEAAKKVDPTITSLNTNEAYQLAYGISHYAGSDRNSRTNNWAVWETLAEAVDDYYENRENAKPLSREIWTILKKELR